MVYAEDGTLKTKSWYKGKTHYDAFQVGNSKGKTYCVSNVKDVVKIEVFQKNKLKKTSEISLTPLADKNKIGKKWYYYFRWNEVKILSEKKIQVLYTITNGVAKIFYGGVAVFDIEKNKIVSNKTVEFSPIKSEENYLYGFKKEYYPIGTVPTEKDNLCIADKTGTILKTYDSDYGLTEDGEYLISEIPESGLNVCRYAFANGQIMIINYSGIYYGSVDTEGFEKIGRVEELPYYVDNYQKKAIFRIAMQDKEHFAVIYATDYEYPNFTLCRYQKTAE